MMDPDEAKARADRLLARDLHANPITLDEVHRELHPSPKPTNVWPIKVAGYGVMLLIAAWWLPAGLTLLAISLIWDGIRWWRRSR